ncbi:MAG TPA: hypothetical protein ENI99_05275 [Sedimenticola sp.]|nr:hypothetical protein [Sedimenticola sp.]
MAPRGKLEKPKIIQPGRARFRWWLTLALLPFMLSGAAWYAYDYGRTSVHFDSSAAAGKVRELERRAGGLQQRVDDLEAERAELRQQVAALERASQIDREAARRVREEIKAIQDERLEMERELAFLRGIVSNNTDRNKLRIQDFKLEATENEDVYRYDFTVSQALTNKADVRGDIRITLVGTRQGKEEALSLGMLTESGMESLKMRFVHFQKLEGLLRLPQGFIASNIRIDIIPDNKKLSRLTETFEWSVGG